MAHRSIISVSNCETLCHRQFTVNHKLQSAELSSADKQTADWYVSIKIVGFEWYDEQSVDLRTRWREDF